MERLSRAPELLVSFAIGWAALLAAVYGTPLLAWFARAGWKLPETTWGQYYDDTNYSRENFRQKRRLILDLLDRDPVMSLDLKPSLQLPPPPLRLSHPPPPPRSDPPIPRCRGRRLA